MSDNVERVFGLVKWFDAEKGYGWITLPGGECDVFVHMKQLELSGVRRPLAPGDQVGCQIRRGNRGWYAINIAIKP